jgi:hypothetical protein
VPGVNARFDIDYDGLIGEGCSGVDPDAGDDTAVRVASRDSLRSPFYSGS